MLCSDVSERVGFLAPLFESADPDCFAGFCPTAV